MTEATSTSQSAPCHLFRLPAELRNYIYELAIFPQPAYQRARTGSYEDPDRTSLARHSHFGYHLSAYYKPAPILAANRQIRAEASKIFYYRSRFFRYHPAGAPSGLGKWVRSLESVDRELVKSIHIDGNSERTLGSVKLMVAMFEDFQYRDLLQIAVRDEREAKGWKYIKVQEILDADD